MKGPWFKNWFNSPYYHQLYFHRDEKEAAAFINKLIDYLHPQQGSKMLDVACGKGRQSMQLSAKGFDVTGIDLSEDSITEALQHENENLHFFTHDMRLPFWINYFDFAFNFFTSFGYFRTEREHDNSIRSIAQSLKPNGTFVMDYLNVHYAEDHLIHKSEKEIDDINFVITKWFDEHHFYKKIEVEDDARQEPLIYTEKVAKFSLGDFTDMFAYQGLQIKEVFGDYNFGNYDVKKSPRLIMIAEKVR
ncbi:bifunctional 2-polyprenyl-6-hydroxyphenol methylase/3-demethylubiquinol 3-O-methyltransferase UbiG [Ferruginibacter sp. HRS2-29]|uniref:class I SAM-dependent methyltransferase n=1 Tax=Ferruginibacter sp. HRS2-29 TaxID=2487334 RepID=UPI0020CC767F|nr:class I SAM-dependent methyltransferase [Ferruginibacter sp. HRS2-29]MCP9753291.1 class I SAM-dependent methyltransferase [Ferruginibacter sp. HRS2-29]